IFSKESPEQSIIASSEPGKASVVSGNEGSSVMRCKTCKQPVGTPTSLLKSDKSGNGAGVSQLSTDLSNYEFQVLEGCEDGLPNKVDYSCRFLAQAKDQAKSIRDTLAGNQNIISVIGLNFLTEITEVAPSFPQVSFAVIDAYVPIDAPNNTQGVLFAEEELGFMAGAVAGSVSKTKVVGIIAGLPFGALQRFAFGFLKGVKYICPQCQVLGRWVNDPTWSSEDIGKAQAEEYINQNCDVIFGAAGGMGSHAIKYAASKKVMVIGVDQDEYVSTFKNGTEPGSEYILTSVLKKVPMAVGLVAKSVIENNFKTGNRIFGYYNNAEEALPCSTPLACEKFNETVYFQDTNAVSGGCSSIVAQPITNLLDTVKTRITIGVLQLNVAQGYIQGEQAAANGTWRQMDTFGIVKAMQGHSQTKVSENKLLIYGGLLSSGEVSNTLYEFNYDNVTLSTLHPTGTDHPAKLMYHSAVFREKTNELVIVAGTLDGSVYNDLMYSYNVAANTWSTVAVKGTIPAGRTLQAVDIIGEEMFMYGGLSQGSILKDFWVFSFTTLTWTQRVNSVSPLAYFGSSLSAVPKNNTLILFGGTHSGSQGNALWSYSTISQEWTSITPSGNAPIGFSQGSAVVLDSRRILYTGGLANGAPQTTSYIYNSGKNAWTNSTKLNAPFAVYGHQASAFNQADFANACQYSENPTLSVCKAIPKTVVLLFGGASTNGIMDKFLINFPADEVIVTPMSIAASILYVCYAFSALGLLISLSMLVATIVFRDAKVFRAASPVFLSFYCVGASLAFVGVILYNVQGNNPQICSATLWCFSTGCIILYGSIVVKNQRIKTIFTGKVKSKSSASIKNHSLYIGLSAIILVNTVLLIIFTASSTLNYHPYDLAIDANNIWPICSSDQMGTWIWILLAPCFFTIVYGIYLSYHTRNVWSQFNESTHINLSVYVTFLAMIILVPLILTIE
ncbi:hypothetical protein HK099_000094, partial [Clydaea vesicula]